MSLLRECLHTAADAIADAIEAASSAGAADALVPLSAAGLKPHGIEYKPALRLADEGTLRTVTIGRRRFTTLRYLLALVDVLPVAKATEQVERDELAEAAQRRARKRSAA